MVLSSGLAHFVDILPTFLGKYNSHGLCGNKPCLHAEADKAPKKKKSHRALDDITESIAELRYMQGAIFKLPKR
jgi:hypothetical protein